MNIEVLLRRILGKPTLRLGRASSLSGSAKILNARRSSDAIVVGDNSRIEGELFVFAHGGEIRIGNWCFVGPGTRIWSAQSIHIGDRVLISHNCTIMDSLTHPVDAAARHLQFKAILTTGHPRDISLDEKPVTIGDDAWLGAGVVVLRGITIGEGAIVGAGSVVTGDVAPYAVVAGNPAREIRSLKPAKDRQ